MTARLARPGIIAASLVFLAATASSAAIGPLDAVPRVRTIDVKHVALDLRFDWIKRQARGTATITMAPLRPTNQITLDAGMLAIESVTLADGSALSFTYDGGDRDDGLVVTLDRIRSAQEDLTIRIGYHTTWLNESDPNALFGSVGKGLRFFSPTSTEPRKRRQLWSMGMPESNRYWFPGYDAPDDPRTTDLIATVETPLTVISNGDLISSTANADGTRSFHWRMSRPYPNHLTSLVIGEYLPVEQRVGDARLLSYGYPDEHEATRASVVRLPDMVKFFTEKIGQPLPNGAYSQVFVQELPWGSGNTMASTLTENMVDDYRTHADYFYLWDGLEAEAVAHQWFGAQLPPRTWSHVWLDRAFAHYFDELFNEHINGRDNFLMWNLLADQATYLADWGAGLRRPIVTDRYDDVFAFAADNYAYSRGAAVLHMLRKELGDDVWWRSIRRYVAVNAGRSVVTEDLERAVEEVSGRPMGWFFDQWVRRVGHPAFSISKRYDEAGRSLVLTVAQAQLPDSAVKDAQVAFFEGSVDVTIDDRIERVWLEPKAENVYSFPLAAAPRLVHFDREGTWIKTMTFSKPLDELLHQLRTDRDVISRNWALGELTALASNPEVVPADRSRILAAMRELIGGDAFWRLRYGGVVRLQGLLAAGVAGDSLRLDDSTVALLVKVARTDTPWMRSIAIPLLGRTHDPRHAELYLEAMKGESHPVIYPAASALGKTRSPKAFDAYLALMKIPSWKGENLLSALNGLAALGDRRGVQIALDALADDENTRWYLATPFWDTRLAAAQTLAALGKGSAGIPITLRRLEKALVEDDVNDVFSSALLLATLGDARALPVFDRLRKRYAADPNALAAVDLYEGQLKQALK